MNVISDLGSASYFYTTEAASLWVFTARRDLHCVGIHTAPLRSCWWLHRLCSAAYSLYLQIF